MHAVEEGQDALTRRPPQARHLVTDIAQTIAAETGSAALMRIGQSPVGPYTINDPSLHEHDLDYQLLLNGAAAAKPVNPLGIPNSACPLVSPDRGIADNRCGESLVLSTGSVNVPVIGRLPGTHVGRSDNAAAEHHPNLAKSPQATPATGRRWSRP